MDYNKKEKANQDICTWLHIKDKQEELLNELGNILPYPQAHYFKNGAMVYCWLLSGFFHTQKSELYLNDMLARIKITFPNSQFLKTCLFENKENKIKPLELKRFQAIKSRAVEIIKETNNFDSTRDFIFWSIKLYAESLISEKGIFSYDDLIYYAFANFENKAKDRSTLKAKCRNIFRWYLDRDFNISMNNNNYIKKDKEEVMSTRQEHARKLSEKKSEDAKRKVTNFITGLYAHEYKKKNGKWNTSKIAKDLNMSRNTVAKHLPKETLF